MTEQQAKRRSPLVLVLLLLFGLAVAAYVYWADQKPEPQASAPADPAAADTANTDTASAASAEETAEQAEQAAQITASAPEPVLAQEGGGAQTEPANDAPAQAASDDVAEPAPGAEQAEPAPAQTATDMAEAEAPVDADGAGAVGPIAPAAEELAINAPEQPSVASAVDAPEVPVVQEPAPPEFLPETLATEPVEDITTSAPEVFASIDAATPGFGVPAAPIAPQGAPAPEIAANTSPGLSALPQAEIPPAATDNNDDQISGLASDGTVPRFDVVRIDANGGIVVAGRAAPESTVTVRLGGDVIAQARVDGNGQFVAIINAPASEAPQALQLESALPEQTSVAGTEAFIVLPAPAGAADTTPALVRSSPETVELVQPFVGEVDAVSLDTISYSTVGAVVLNGRAQPGTAIRAYADDGLIGETVVGESGQWRLDVPGLDAGVYRLRIDEIDASGAVTSRVESPFQRETPEAAAAQALAAQAGGQVIVQPGNTLWLLASQAYGEGLLYTQIFAANSDSIRDPDLIYPGQVFAIPVLP
ncbi:MAG: LysM peptidoglycan-binding domain-containing protein [Paracoccaceae bacterium]